MTNSSTTQVLATKGNQALIGADKFVTDLLPGQLGFFNADTKKSIVSTSDFTKARKFFIAVGVDTDGDGTADEVRYQAGESVQKEGIRNLTFTPASAERGQKFLISALKADCDTEYLLKMEFFGPMLMETHGHNRITKQYSVKTSCCDNCTTGCATGSCVELATKLVESLNLDTEKLFKASLMDPTTGTVITDIVTWAADPANADLCPNIEIETLPKGIAVKCGFNFNYDKVRTILVQPYLISGFSCAGKIQETQAASPATGKAYDLKYFEEIAFGYKNNNSVYRLLGPGIQKNYYSIIDGSKNYDIFWLQNSYEIHTGSEEFQNMMQTILAVPEGDAVTVRAIAVMFSALPNFDSLVDETANADVSPTAPENEILVVPDVDTDGIA
jgi:hypothetical protein